jgi:thiol-disulfide isomerase/thioredoxin
MDTHGRRRPLIRGTIIGLVALLAALGAAGIWNAVAGSDDAPSTDATIHFDPTDKEPPDALVQGDRTGTSVPTTSFVKLGGGTGTLADYRGKKVVVNFFASWCVPCRKEMPAVERVHRSLGDDVVILGLAVRDSERDASAIVKSTGVSYDIGRDPSGKLFSDLGGLNMPSTFFVSAQGKVVKARAGALSEKELRGLIADAFGDS